MKQKFFKILLVVLVGLSLVGAALIARSYGIGFLLATAWRSWLLDLAAVILTLLVFVTIARVTGLPFPRWLPLLLILAILAIPFAASILRGEGLFPSPRVAAVYVRELIGSVVVVFAFWVTWQAFRPSNNRPHPNE